MMAREKAKDWQGGLFVKAQNKWFDGYDGESNILLDDYDCGTALGHLLKIWCHYFARFANIY